MRSQRDSQIRNRLSPRRGDCGAAHRHTSPILSSTSAAPHRKSPTATRQDWPIYGGDANGDRYSPLTADQSRKRKATPHSLASRRRNRRRLADQSTHRRPHDVHLHARPSRSSRSTLRPAAKLWTFDPGVKATQPSRGFSYWTDGKQSILFAGVMDHLYALDPATGKPIASFRRRRQRRSAKRPRQ